MDWSQPLPGSIYRRAIYHARQVSGRASAHLATLARAVACSSDVGPPCPCSASSAGVKQLDDRGERIDCGQRRRPDDELDVRVAGGCERAEGVRDLFGLGESRPSGRAVLHAPAQPGVVRTHVGRVTFPHAKRRCPPLCGCQASSSRERSATSWPAAHRGARLVRLARIPYRARCAPRPDRAARDCRRRDTGGPKRLVRVPLPNQRASLGCCQGLDGGCCRAVRTSAPTARPGAGSYVLEAGPRSRSVSAGTHHRPRRDGRPVPSRRQGVD